MEWGGLRRNAEGVEEWEGRDARAVVKCPPSQNFLTLRVTSLTHPETIAGQSSSIDSRGEQHTSRLSTAPRSTPPESPVRARLPHDRVLCPCRAADTYPPSPFHFFRLTLHVSRIVR